MNRVAWAIAVPSGLAIIACATIYAPREGPECTTDSQCAGDQICSLDQGQRCISATSLPRRPTFAAIIDYVQAGQNGGTGSRTEVHVAGCELEPKKAISSVLMESSRQELTTGVEFAAVVDERPCPGPCRRDCLDAEVISDEELSCIARRTGQMTLTTPTTLAWFNPLQDILAQDPPADLLWRDVKLGPQTVLRCAKPAAESLPTDKPVYSILSAFDQEAVVKFLDPDETDESTVEESEETQPLPSGRRDLIPESRAVIPQHGVLWDLKCSQEPDDALKFGLDTHQRCSGDLYVAIKPAPGFDPSDTRLEIALRHAMSGPGIGGRNTIFRAYERVSPFGIVQPRQGTGILCTNDDECKEHLSLGAEFACGEDNTCGLDLRGKLAGQGTSTSTGTDVKIPVATFSTGCDEGTGTGGSITRTYDFSIEPAPLQDIIVPTIEQTLDLRFSPAGGTLVARVTACVPYWRARPAQTVLGGPLVNGIPSALLIGPAAQLLSGRSCCDSSCLQTEEQNATSCMTTEKPIVTATWSMSEEQWTAWQGEGCQAISDIHRAGTFEQQAQCTSDGYTCGVDLPQFGSDPNECLSLAVKITRPSTSIYRSWQRAAPLKVCGQKELAPTPLDGSMTFRPVIRGKLRCVGNDDGANPTCSEEIRARIIAQRLAEPQHVDGSETPLGPFFFTQSIRTGAKTSGEFALPVEPGIYVLTALPEPGEASGPARFSVVDARDDSPALALDSTGLWATNIEDPATQLTLEPGVPVRLHLEGYGVGAKVLPLDTGSWIGDAENPLVQLGIDLNDKNTCLPLNRGCQIRALRPIASLGSSDGNVTLDFSNTAHFTTRAGGPQECPQGG
jgi:hypothetical protein